MSIAKRIDLDQQEGALNEDDAFERLRTLCNRVNPFRHPTLREVNMSPRLIVVAATAICASGLAFAQGPGPGKGGMMQFGPNNAAGWSMMTPQERTAHQDTMHSFKTLEECKAYMADHSKQMAERAKERKLTYAGPRENACEVMQSRGGFK
jgi:hypothetical protein